MANRDFHRRKPYRQRPRKVGRGRSGTQPLSILQMLMTVGLVVTFAGFAWKMALSQSDGADDPVVSSFGSPPHVEDGGRLFSCNRVNVVDGDTFRCDGTRIRLQGIDAPEAGGRCRPGRDCAPGDPVASTANLRALLSRGPTECRATDTDIYGRTVARCTTGGADLSCAQIRAGHAILRYAPINC